MKFLSLVLSAGLILGASTIAKADTFIYHDTDYDFTFSYPDSWRLNTVTGTERVRIAPLHGQDGAECSMSVVKDGRLLIYPENYGATTMPITLDDTFWAKEVLPNYENVTVHKYHAAAGLGQGFATSVQITWGGDVQSVASVGIIEEEAPMPLSATDGLTSADLVEDVKVFDENMDKTIYRANMFATIYGEHRYMFSCQAAVDKFPIWQEIFASITSSVRLESKYALYPTGYYRNFLADKPLLPKTE